MVIDMQLAVCLHPHCWEALYAWTMLARSHLLLICTGKLAAKIVLIQNV